MIAQSTKNWSVQAKIIKFLGEIFKLQSDRNKRFEVTKIKFQKAQLIV